MELVAAEVPSPVTVTPTKRPSGAEKRRRRAVRAAAEATHAETWPAVYLDQYAKHGNLKLAAVTAGVEPKAIKARIKADAEFAEQVKAAHEEFCDGLEHALVILGINKNNALALLARLKAERPQKYQDELRINAQMKAIVAHVVAPEAASELLRLMVADATTVTLQALSSAGSVGSVALPMPEKQAGQNALVIVEPFAGLPEHAQGFAGRRDST